MTTKQDKTIHMQTAGLSCVAHGKSIVAHEKSGERAFCAILYI